jgi:hypothetical protein
MAVEFKITDQKFWNDFTSPAVINTLGVSTTDINKFSRNLIGSVGQYIYTEYNIEYSVSTGIFTGDTSEDFFNDWEYSVSGNDTTFKRKDGGSYIEDGFKVTDQIVFSAVWRKKFGQGVGLFNIWAEVSFVDDDEMILINFNINPFAANLNPPANMDLFIDSAGFVAQGLIGEHITQVFVASSSIELSYGLLENQESFSNFSKIDGSQQTYYKRDINGSGRFFFKGATNSWRADSDRLRVVGNGRKTKQDFLKRASDFPFGSTTFEIYFQTLTTRIGHRFLLVPFYLEDQINNIKNKIPPSYLEGNNSLKYSFSAELRNDINNPNTSKVVTYNTLLGYVGYYNQQFNGLASRFSVNNLKYVNSIGKTVNQLDISGTTVSFDVISIDNVFSNSSSTKPFGVVRHFRLSTSDQYTETRSTTLTGNFLYGAVGINSFFEKSVDFDNITFTYVNSGLFKVSFDIGFRDIDNAGLPSLGEEYCLAVTVGSRFTNNDYDQNKEDQVTLIVDVNEYDKNTDIPGLLGVKSFDLYDNGALSFAREEGYTDFKGWNEDGVLLKSEIQVKDTSTLDSVTLQVVAENQSNTEDYFVIDSFPVDLSNTTLVGNVRQIELEQNAGFFLNEDDVFNKIKITTLDPIPNVQPYLFEIPFKIPWQSWIGLNSADTVFYDKSKNQNGLNRKTSNYSYKNNYRVKIYIDNDVRTNVNGTDITTQYLVKSPDLDIRDYDDDGNNPVEWSCLIETFDINDVNLNGQILGDEFTRIKSTFTNNTNPPTSVNDFLGIIRIEEQLQEGNNIYELSTNALDFEGNLLAPLEGFTNTKITLVGNSIILECQINLDTINPDVSYSLSTEIRDYLSESPLCDYNTDYSTDYCGGIPPNLNKLGTIQTGIQFQIGS